MKTFTEIILEHKCFDEQFKFYDPAKNSLWNYVAGYTVVNINKFLREKKHIAKLDEICLNIDSFMKPLNNKILYRTVEWDYLNNIYGISKDNLDVFIGKKLKANGYTSTTETRKNIWSDIWIKSEVFMEISVNNVNGVYINDIFKPDDIDCADQNEVLLQRNLDFEIYGYEMMSDTGKTRTIKNKNIYCLKIRTL